MARRNLDGVVVDAMRPRQPRREQRICFVAGQQTVHRRGNLIDSNSGATHAASRSGEGIAIVLDSLVERSLS
jgi:hypothetical protein